MVESHGPWWKTKDNVEDLRECGVMSCGQQRSSSSSSGGASLTGHSCLHEFTPLGTVLRTLPRRVEAEIVLLEVELNRSKPGSSWSTRWATPVHSLFHSCTNIHVTHANFPQFNSISSVSVASLGLMSPGAATDGVTRICALRKTNDLF